VVQIGAGFDFDGWQHEIHNHFSNYGRDDTWDMTNAFSPSVEILKQQQNVLIGLGLEVQLARENKPYDYYLNGTGKFGFVPVYADLRYQTPLTKQLNSELIFNGGYNFVYGDKKFSVDEEWHLSGGLYFGMGLGLVFNNIVLQLMYKENRATKSSGEIEGFDFDHLKYYITNRQTNVTLGYRF